MSIVVDESRTVRTLNFPECKLRCSYVAVPLFKRRVLRVSVQARSEHSSTDSLFPFLVSLADAIFPFVNGRCHLTLFSFS